MLYALHQQAEKGKCTEPKPWGWNIVESAKWNSWTQLGDMASVEAMRLYVKFLETEIQVSTKDCRCVRLQVPRRLCMSSHLEGGDWDKSVAFPVNSI